MPSKINGCPVEDRYTLQDFSSRQDSITKKISDSGEHLGLDSFFSEGIPFDSVTSKNVACKIVDTIVFLSNNSDQEVLHVYEFGAGLGILAANILDLLSFYHLDIYKRIKLHISDISQCKLDELKGLPALKKHESQLVYQVCDLISPSFEPFEKPLLVYHSYLFAALPVRHLIMSQGEIYEVLVKASIHSELVVVDTEGDAPKNLDATEIKRFCEREAENISPFFARRLSPFINEEYDIVPLDTRGIGSEELAVLRSWVAHANPKEMEFFNFHYLAIKSTLELMKNLPQDAAYLSIDIGESHLVQEKQCIELLSKYGPYTYYPFSFSAMTYCAKKLGIDCQLQAQFAFSKSNVACLMSNTRDNPQYHYHFDKVFRNSQPEYYEKMRHTFKSIKNNREFSDLLSSWPELHKSYLFWLGLARMMIGKNLYDAAIQCLNHAVEQSNGLSTTAQLLLAEVYERAGLMNKALNACEDLCMNHTVVDEVAFIKLCKHYENGEEFEKLIFTIKRWIKCTRRNMVTEQIDMLNHAIDRSKQDHSVVFE